MKKMILIVAALFCFGFSHAAEKDQRLWKMAQNDARKVEVAVGLNKKQYRQIADFQYIKYEALAAIRKDASLTDEQRKKALNGVHQQYSKSAKSVMTPEQVETFVKWRKKVAEQQKNKNQSAGQHENKNSK